MLSPGCSQSMIKCIGDVKSWKMQDVQTANFGWRTPQRLTWQFNMLYPNLLPSLLQLELDFYCGLMALSAFPALSLVFSPGISFNKIITCLIPYWNLLLRGPRLTYPSNSTRTSSWREMPSSLHNNSVVRTAPHDFVLLHSRCFH